MHRNWQDLISPSNVEIVTLTDTYGKFIAKPLERGYGTTLGNSLRRVLLSSINGAAVVAVRIDGVDHELSTIQGVKEDVGHGPWRCPAYSGENMQSLPRGNGARDSNAYRQLPQDNHPSLQVKKSRD